MLRCTNHNGTLIFSVRVVPRASQSRVVGEHDGLLRIRIAAPPVDGAANKELIRVLADWLDVPTRNIEIVRGATSKTKQVRVANMDCERVQSLASDS